MSKFVTVKDVPLLKVGTWNASTGTASVTEQDLADIVDAYASGDLDIPVIKIGHIDGRFANPEQDGEPAYGQIENLRAEDDGKTLLGDYVRVPEELAGKLESAYPYRSVEFYRGMELKDETGKVVKEYPVVLTAVALLGATPPAVTGLGNVHAEFKAGAKGLCSLSTAQFAFPGGLTGNALRQALDGALTAWVKANAAEDDKPEWGWDVWVTDYDDTSFWYRIEGETYQRGYTITDGVMALADEATPVVEERTFKPTGSPIPAPVPGASADTAPVPPATAASADSGTDSTPQGDHEFKETTPVDILAELRTLFGLPADADDQAVLDAATTAKTAEDAAGGDGTNASTGAPTDSVTVSAVAFSNLQATVTNLEARNEALENAATAKRRDEIVATALSEGRLTPPEVKPWRDALDEAEASTVALLATRTPIFNTVEQGHAASLSAVNDTRAKAIEAADDAYLL
jgi:hypothetical protein